MKNTIALFLAILIISACSKKEANEEVKVEESQSTQMQATQSSEQLAFPAQQLLQQMGELKVVKCMFLSGKFSAVSNPEVSAVSSVTLKIFSNLSNQIPKTNQEFLAEQAKTELLTLNVEQELEFLAEECITNVKPYLKQFSS
jgi:uncharacterized lipoprotein